MTITRDQALNALYHSGELREQLLLHYYMGRESDFHAKNVEAAFHAVAKGLGYVIEPYSPVSGASVEAAEQPCPYNDDTTPHNSVPSGEVAASPGTRQVVVVIKTHPPGARWPYTAEAYGFEGAGQTWIQAFDDLALHMARHEEDGRVLR